MNKEDKLAIRRENTNHYKDICQRTWSNCCNCGSDKNIEIHHIVPLANGGNNIITNMVALCKDCHLKAHGKLKRVENAKKGGRKPIKKPANADIVIKQYLEGIITRTEAIQRLKLSKGWKINELWYFQEYLKEHNIIAHKNYIDNFFGKNRKKRSDDKFLAAKITYADGNTQEFWKHGGLRNVLLEAMEKGIDDISSNELACIAQNHGCKLCFVPTTKVPYIQDGIDLTQLYDIRNRNQ